MKQMFEYAEKYVNKNFPILDFSYSKNKIEEIPTTQVMVFCRNSDGKYCIVKDYDESYYSLPGGGCDLGEKDENCAHREVFEEAQFKIHDIKLIGNTIVNISDKKGTVVSKSKHVRFHAKIDSIKEFIPRKHGMETVERKFIDFKDLKKKVLLLQNPIGDEILKEVKKII